MSLLHVKILKGKTGHRVVTKRLGSVIGWQTLAAAKAGPNKGLTLSDARTLAKALDEWIEGQVPMKRSKRL